jgi:hypothetical protein
VSSQCIPKHWADAGYAVNREVECHSASGNTGSHEAMTLAQTWLTECVENHSECRRIQEIPYLPTRLIDVTEGESSDWRLYIPSEDKTMAVPLSYMTLSHCWGKLEFLRLLSNNIDTLKAGMRLSDLTKTFRDAVTVVLEATFVAIGGRGGCNIAPRVCVDVGHATTFCSPVVH